MNGKRIMDSSPNACCLQLGEGTIPVLYFDDIEMVARAAVRQGQTDAWNLTQSLCVRRSEPPACLIPRIKVWEFHAQMAACIVSRRLLSPHSS